VTAPVRLIAAMTIDRVIGRGDGMPWNVPEEYRHFLDSVRGGAVIMGRRSFEIFGADLADSQPIVLTRRDHAPTGALSARDLEAALDAARRLGLAPWIAGGGGLVLDFNYAYAPSCAHDPRWACPLAPPENALDVELRAGELESVG